MVNDLNDTHHEKPKSAIKGSKSSPLTHVIDDPLDEFSNSDDQTNHITTPTGITSLQPTFPYKTTQKPNKMARFKLLPK